MSAFSQIVQTDELVQVAFDSICEKICVLDRGGWIVLTNEAWNQSARQNGASPARCGPGVNYLRVCRTAAGPFAERALEAAIGIDTVLRGACPQFNLDYPCPSPSRKAWFRLTARPLRRPCAGAVVLHSDKTAQVLLSDKLRNTQAQYDALMDNPVHVATVLAADGNIRYQSPACEGVFGARPEELVGRPIFEFVHTGDAEAVRGLLRDCLEHPHRRHICEYRFHGRNGSWRTLESVASNLLSHPEGGILLNSRDITHRKLAERTQRAEYDALARDRRELEALAARLLREQEEERRLVAAELNGKLGQRLACMSLQAAHVGVTAAAAGQTHALQESVASLGRDLHQLGHNLYPPMLDHFGLAVALRDHCAEFERKQGVPVHYVHRGISSRLAVRIAAALYRVAEEGLSNVARHAVANQVWLTLSRTAKGLHLAIRDDGAGFDPAAVQPGSGLGILAMRERLHDVNGSLSIRSRAGGGTEVVALAPLAVSLVHRPLSSL
jgi:two-component system, NarL family, sensor histidine kinase UhpB